MARRWQIGRTALGLALGALLAGWSVAGTTNTVATAADLLRQGYLAVVDAELARAEKNGEAARTAYRAAIGLFGRLQAEYPGWQGDAVSRRILACNEALAALDATSATGQPVAARDAAHDTNAVAALARLVEEMKNARALLAAGIDAKAVAAGEADAARELERLRDERDQAVESRQVLARRVAKLEAQLERRKTATTNTPSQVAVGALKADARRLMEAGDNAGAAALLREASALLPEETDFKVLLGVAACRGGRFDEAVAVLKPFDTKGCTNAAALLTLGTAYMGMGRVGDARVATEKSLSVDPKSPDANYNMAQILLTIRPPDPDTAQRYYRRARELGLPADVDFENSLRVATILSHVRKRK